MIDYITRYEGQSHLGYFIVTESELITIMIDNYNLCCEQWGVICSDDEPQHFRGALLLDIVAVNEKNDAIAVPDLYEGGVIFVNVVTNKGTFQIALYNGHNGYYGHDVNITRWKKTSEWQDWV